MSIEIQGLNELNAKLGQLKQIAEDTMQDELADIALDLGSKCANAAPVESGDLRGDLANPQIKMALILVGRLVQVYLTLGDNMNILNIDILEVVELSS